MKRTTLKDVAKKAGVSNGTVSAVINNKDTVKGDTRENILRVIKELNYRPQGSARTLKGEVENSIGLITRTLDNPYYTSIAMGIKHYANLKGYVLFIACSEGSHETEKKISHLFSSKEIKGSIIAPVIDGTNEIDHFFKMKSVNYPFVLLENIPGLDISVVGMNNVIATEKATKYLLDCGHKSIIHFAGPSFASHTIDRINGFRSAFSETTLRFNKDLIIECGSHFDDGYSVGYKYFNNFKKKEDAPTAVVCYDDFVAFGLISALKDLSINVPNDVSIIGIDDISYSKYWSPKLTTISVPLEEIGQIAAEILINTIENHKVMPTVKKIIEPELIIRETTKDLRKK